MMEPTPFDKEIEKASAEIENTLLEYRRAQVDTSIYVSKLKMEAYILQLEQYKERLDAILLRSKIGAINETLS